MKVALYAVVFLTSVLLSRPTQAQGETLDAIFASGNEAFFRGDFVQASEQYRRLIDAGVRDPDVYFNLATAYGRRDELGYAVLYFERAARLAPGDEQVQTQLRQLREALSLRAAKRSGEAIMRVRPPIREALVSNLSVNALAYLILLFEFLCLAAWIARRFARKDTTRLAALLTFVLSGLLTLLAAAGFMVKIGLGQEGEPAVVVTADVLREGPDKNAQGRGQVEEGTLAKVLLRDGDFLQVDVMDGQRGWLPKDAVGLVNPD